jgi:hypothetical protein
LLLTTFENSWHVPNQLPELTAFHKNNAAKVTAFTSTAVVARIT